MTTSRTVIAYFVIAGFTGSTDDITSLLGMNAEDSGTAGERRTMKGGVDYLVKDSYWKILGTVTDNTSIDGHIVELLDRLSGLESKLAGLPPEVVKKIEIVVTIAPHMSPPGWYLDAATLRRLATLGIDVELDIG